MAVGISCGDRPWGSAVAISEDHKDAKSDKKDAPETMLKKGENAFADSAGKELGSGLARMALGEAPVSASTLSSVGHYATLGLHEVQANAPVINVVASKAATTLGHVMPSSKSVISGDSAMLSGTSALGKLFRLAQP
jgi:hypothetical protein